MSDMECHIGPLVSTSDGIASVNTSFSATLSDSILVSPSREGLLLMDTMSNKDDNRSSSRSIVLNTECNKEGRSSFIYFNAKVALNVFLPLNSQLSTLGCPKLTV